MTIPNGADCSANVAKAFEDINTAVSNYVSAVTKSTAALWQGIEEITRNVGGLSQENFARCVSAYTSLASAKSPQEAMSAQAEFVKESFDNAVANGSKVTELSARVAKDAISPLTQHANETISAVMSKVKGQ
ncbi:MAG: phasin family protein [Alphaproteobacteria bacterium]|nr:phasin family protein [Alphaproteobacteria bacterium]